MNRFSSVEWSKSWLRVGGGLTLSLYLWPRLIQHTKALMNSDEKLCIKVLRILQEMLIPTLDFDEKVKA